MAPSLHVPWLLGRDFNVITKSGEQKGGFIRRLVVSIRFCGFLYSNGLRDLGYVGLHFTWNRGNLFQRLDQCVCNTAWLEAFHETTVSSLPRVASDHKLLLLRPF